MLANGGRKCSRDKIPAPAPFGLREDRTKGHEGAGEIENSWMRYAMRICMERKIIDKRH